MFFKLNLVLPVVCLAGICVSVHVKHEFFASVLIPIVSLATTGFAFG